MRTFAKFTVIAFSFGIFINANAAAQVFTVNPDADTGEVAEGTGEALHGVFGLDGNSDRSYNVYRKLAGLNRVDTGQEIHTLTPIDGNNSQAIWEGVDHGGSGTESGFHDPGMYIGNSPSPSSYPDQLIYFGPNANGTSIDDPDGGVGGDNLPNDTFEPDSNDRVNWEVSVGFLEDPDGFVDGRAPNSGDWDMWSGSYGTDGIGMRLFFTASDSDELDGSDWFSFNESAGSDVPGARPQSGDPDSLIGGETARDSIPTVRRFVGSGREIDEFDGDFPAGGGDGQAVYVGVGYDDMMELSWKMELNDPENADPVRSREVRFSAKTGNLEYVSIFDPEGIPNELNDPDTEWSEGRFDWENATPVFYLGLDNGTDYGDDGASGIMGVFIPGDFNADGVVDDTDRGIITANMDGVDTSYSLGDLNQDGVTNMSDLTAWDQLGGDPKDRIDSITDPTERLDYVHDVLGTWMGDSNCDGEFNSSDLVTVFTAGQYEDGVAGNSTWATGDWNGDGEFDSSDFVTAFTDGGYENGPRPAAVPETSGPAPLLFAIFVLNWIRRKRV